MSFLSKVLTFLTPYRDLHVQSLKALKVEDQMKALKAMGLDKNPKAFLSVHSRDLVGTMVRSEITELAIASGLNITWVLNTYLAAGGENTLSWDPRARMLVFKPEGMRDPMGDPHKQRLSATNWAVGWILVFAIGFVGLLLASLNLALNAGTRAPGMITWTIVLALFEALAFILVRVNARDERRFKSVVALQDAGLIERPLPVATKAAPAPMPARAPRKASASASAPAKPATPRNPRSKTPKP